MPLHKQEGVHTYVRTYVCIVGRVEGTIVSQLLQALTLRLLLCVKVLFDFSGQRRITSGYIQVRKILQKTHHKPICEPHIRTPAPQCSMQYSTLHGVLHLCDAHMHACTCTVAWQAAGPSQISVPHGNWQAGQL